MRSYWFLAGAVILGTSATLVDRSARAAPRSEEPAQTPDSPEPEESEGSDEPRKPERSDRPTDRERSARPQPTEKEEEEGDSEEEDTASGAPDEIIDPPAAEPETPTGDQGETVVPRPDGDTKRELPFDPGPDAPPKAIPSLGGAPGAKRILLEEAIELALSRHPRLIPARERVNAAETRIGQSQAAWYPQIDGSLQYLRASENGSLASFHSVPGMSRVGGSIREGVRPHHSFNNFLAAVVVQQQIYDFGRTQGEVGARRARVKAAEMEQVLAEQTVTFEVIRAFYDVHAARASVAVARDILATTRGVLELAEAAKQAGMRPPSEKARAEADVAAAEVRLIRAEASLDIARTQVAFAIGAVGESFDPIEQPLSADSMPSERRCIETALQNRPELGALDFERDGLEQDLESTKGRQYPRIDGLGSVSSRGQFLPAADQDPYHRLNWNIGVVVSIPIFQGLLIRKQKEEIRAKINSVDGGKEAVRQAVVLEVKRARAMVRAADAAETASLRGVRAAEEALETLQERYAGGLADLVELTDVQDAYLAARSQAVQARYDRYVARAILSLAMGTPGTLGG